MSSSRVANVPAGLEQRLDEIRGGAPHRSPTVRVLAAYAQHTACKLATLGFAAGVDFDRLLIGTPVQAPFGQSPFAIQRGLAFEKMLRANNHRAALDALRTVLPLPPVGAARVKNLREGFPAGPERMPARARATEELLGLIVRGAATAPHLIDGAVLPASIGGLAAYFEADALAACAGGQVRAAEVKSFPKVDDRVDPDKLGAALDQVAFYILLLSDVIARLGGDPKRLVSNRALLITPRNTSLTPTLSEQRVEARIRRARRLLDAIPAATDVAASVPGGVSFGPVASGVGDTRRRLDVLHDLADRVGTAYEPSCLSSCGNARFCRERAHEAGSPCLSGTSTLRLLPGVATLARAEALTRGAAPAQEEEPAAALLERAGRLYDTANDPATGVVTPARRLA